MWNAPGNALLVMSFADFDVTNQSYYGEQKLHYIPADPTKADAGRWRIHTHTRARTHKYTSRDTYVHTHARATRQPTILFLQSGEL